MKRNFGLFVVGIVPFIWALASLVFAIAGYDVATAAVMGLVTTALSVTMIRVRYREAGEE